MLAWSAFHGWGHPAAFIFCNHSYVTANSSFLIHTHLLVVKAKPQPHYFNLQLLNHFKELTREPPTWCLHAAGSRDGKCWEGVRNINQEVTPFGFRWPYTPWGRTSFCTIYTEVGESMEKWLSLTAGEQEKLKDQNCHENCNIFSFLNVWVNWWFFWFFILRYWHCNSQKCYCAGWIVKVLFQNIFLFNLSNIPLGEETEKPMQAIRKTDPNKTKWKMKIKLSK